MDFGKEIALYDNMTEMEDLIETIQGRIYGFENIPIEKRDELSRKLYEVLSELVDYSNQLGESLAVMEAF